MLPFNRGSECVKIIPGTAVPIETVGLKKAHQNSDVFIPVCLLGSRLPSISKNYAVMSVDDLSAEAQASEE